MKKFFIYFVLLCYGIFSFGGEFDPCYDSLKNSTGGSSNGISIRDVLFQPDGSIKKEYIGQENGFPKFADDHFDKNMWKTFNKVSSALTKQEMDQLQWKNFDGDTEEFRNLRSKIFQPDGSIKNEYIGQENGYPQCADDHFDKKMKRTFTNVSAVVSGFNNLTHH